MLFGYIYFDINCWLLNITKVLYFYCSFYRCLISKVTETQREKMCYLFYSVVIAYFIRTVTKLNYHSLYFLYIKTLKTTPINFIRISSTVKLLEIEEIHFWCQSLDKHLRDA